MQRNILPLSKQMAEFALPNFMYYCWATNIKNLQYWTDEASATPTAWVQLEISFSQNSLQWRLYSQLPVSFSAIIA